MSDLVPAGPVFYFASFLYHQSINVEFLKDLFNQKCPSPFLIFEHDFCPMKKFYSKEMGPTEELSRIILVSTTLMQRTSSVDLKLWSTQIENEYSFEKKRKINFDIGYLSLEQLILLTGKNFVHRIYLDQGVYVDLNLIYEQNNFKSLAWTYPDYQHPDFIEFFLFARNLLLQKINS